jgi:hypothetical protein
MFILRDCQQSLIMVTVTASWYVGNSYHYYTVDCLWRPKILSVETLVSFWWQIHAILGTSHKAVFPPSAQVFCCGRMLKSMEPLYQGRHWPVPPTARGVTQKLHQLDNSDHTKRQFELVTRLGHSRISNYTACSARAPLCPVRYTGTERGQCKPTSELLMWGRYPPIDTFPPYHF